jgi:hypothetical protein
MSINYPNSIQIIALYGWRATIRKHVPKFRTVGRPVYQEDLMIGDEVALVHTGHLLEGEGTLCGLELLNPELPSLFFGLVLHRTDNLLTADVNSFELRDDLASEKDMKNIARVEKRVGIDATIHIIPVMRY